MALGRATPPDGHAQFWGLSKGQRAVRCLDPAGTREGSFRLSVKCTLWGTCVGGITLFSFLIFSQYYSTTCGECYSCPGAFVTNQYTLGGLKQQSQTLRVLEVRRQKARSSPPLEAQGQNPSLAFPVSGSCQSPLAGGCNLSSLPSSSRHLLLWLCLLLFCLCPVSLCLSLLRTLFIGFRTHLYNPGWFSPLKGLSFITSAKTPFQIR